MSPRRLLTGLLPVILLAALVLSACAPPNRTGSEETNPEAITMGQSRPAGKPIDLGGLFGSDDEEDEEEAAAQGDSEEVARLEQQVARLEESLRSAMAGRDAGRGTPEALGGRGGPGVGVVFAEERDAAAARMQSAFARVASDYPLRLIGHQPVAEELERHGCSSRSPMECAGAIAIHPGARILAVVDGPDGARVEVRLIDTELGVGYRPLRLELPLADGQPAAAGLEALADAVYLNALQRLRLTPPIFHAVSGEEEGRWFLNAGRDSGLQEGDLLAIHDGGRVIRSPGGSPAAWVPGAVRGRLRVDSFSGGGTAIATLVEGDPPRASDPLVPVR